MCVNGYIHTMYYFYSVIKIGIPNKMTFEQKQKDMRV